MPSSTKRINFDVSLELAQVIEDLTLQSHSSSKAEMMRKAIALMQTAQKAKREGKALAIVDEKTNQAEVRLVI